jgi:hypothetical protein
MAALRRSLARLVCRRQPLNGPAGLKTVITPTSFSSSCRLWTPCHGARPGRTVRHVRIDGGVGRRCNRCRCRPWTDIPCISKCFLTYLVTSVCPAPITAPSYRVPCAVCVCHVPCSVSYAVCRVLCAIRVRMPCAVCMCRILCAMCSVPYAVCSVPCAVCLMQCPVRTVHYAPCTVHCAVCRVHCALWALCSVHCAVCSVPCALWAA